MIMPSWELNEDGIREVCTYVERVNKFEPKSTIKPKTIGQKRNCEIFNKLIEQFNESLRIFKGKVVKDVITDKKLDNYKEICEKQNNLKTKKDILISYIKKELNQFGKLKPKLSEKCDELYNDMTRMKGELKKNPLKNIKNIKLLIAASENLNESKKNFNRYKITIKKLKKDTEKNSGVFKDSTFLHTIINYKNENNHETYAGMAGILIKVNDGINKLIENDKYKHLRSKITIKAYRYALAKGFLDCLRKYNTCIRAYENIKQREENSSESSSNEVFKTSCEKFEKDAFELADIMFKQFQNRGITYQTMMSWMKETQEETEKLKQNFMYENDLGDNKHLENLAVTFAKVCISTAFCMNIDKLEKYISRCISQNDEMKNMFCGSIKRCFQFTFVKSISKSLSLSPIYTVIFSICQAVCILAFIMSLGGDFTSIEEEKGKKTVYTALDIKKFQKETQVQS